MIFNFVWFYCELRAAPWFRCGKRGVPYFSGYDSRKLISINHASGRALFINENSSGEKKTTRCFLRFSATSKSFNLRSTSNRHWIEHCIQTQGKDRSPEGVGGVKRSNFQPFSWRTCKWNLHITAWLWIIKWPSRFVGYPKFLHG